MADNSNNHLVAEARDTFGKGAARKIRAIGKIPAVIYGHGTEPQHVTLPGHETALILRKSNQVLELDIAGKTELALVKDVQKDPVRQIIEHIDLIVIKKGEKVQVEVPVHLVGETFSGTTVDQDLHVLKLEVEATHIPENVEVNVEGLTEGSHVYAKDAVLPKGAALIDEPEALILTVYVPTGNAADEAADEAVAAAASAESAAESAE